MRLNFPFFLPSQPAPRYQTSESHLQTPYDIILGTCSSRDFVSGSSCTLSPPLTFPNKARLLKEGGGAWGLRTVRFTVSDLGGTCLQIHGPLACRSASLDPKGVQVTCTCLVPDRRVEASTRQYPGHFQRLVLLFLYSRHGRIGATKYETKRRAIGGPRGLV